MSTLSSRFFSPVTKGKSSKVLYNLTEDMTAYSFVKSYYAINLHVIQKSDEQSFSAKTIDSTSSACTLGSFFCKCSAPEAIRCIVDFYICKAKHALVP